MKNNKLFNHKNQGKLLLAGISLVVPAIFLLLTMNDYEYAATDARTESFHSDIEVLPNGDVQFAESRVRYLNYRTMEQSLYFGADDEDVSSLTHQPVFDTTTFANRVYDENDNLLIEGDGTTFVNLNYGSERLYLTYSWLDNAVNELGQPFETVDNQSVNVLHHHSAKWGKARFEYDYLIKGVALKYSDTGEFYWTVAATDFMKTENVTISITLPGINYQASDVKAYAFGANKAKVESIEKNEDGQVVVKLSASRLYPDEALITRVNFPMYALNIPNNLYGNIVHSAGHLHNVAIYQSQYELPRTIYRIADLVAFIVLGVAVVYALALVFIIFVKYDKERTSSFFGEYYRELPAEYPPAIMGYLYRFKEVTKDDVSATLMDLIRRGFIDVDLNNQLLTDAKADYILIYHREKNTSDLLPHEKQLLRWFFDLVGAGKDTLSLAQLAKYTSKEQSAIKYLAANDDFIRAVDATASAKGFFDNVFEAWNKGRHMTVTLIVFSIIFIVTKLLGFGTFTMIIGGILLALSLVLSAYFGSILRRSKQGHEDFVRWAAFEKFLKEFPNLKDYPIPGIAVWEHYMVYAVSFGIADLVEKQLRFKFTELGASKELESSMLFRYPGFHYYYWYGVNRSFVAASQTIKVAQQQRNSARGGGGRFGGGGGGFTGGGGSGVSLR